jgi:hypothetical protein
MSKGFFNYSNLLLFLNNRFFFPVMQRKNPIIQKLLIFNELIFSK